MGVKVKKEDPAMSYNVAFTLNGLIGKFRVDSYDDIDLIREKRAVLPIAEFQQLVNGDQKKVNLYAHKPSKVTKSQFAWMSKEEFKAAIHQRGFNQDEVEFLEYWLVKE